MLLSFFAFLRKFWQTILISLQRHLAYKINFILMIIGPSVVFLFVQINLWQAIYGLDQSIKIQGYDLRQMLQYQFWVFLVQIVGKGHNSMNLAMDIRYGRISSYLLYPFPLWGFHFASFLSFQWLQMTIAALTIASFSLMNFIEIVGAMALIKGIVITLVVSITWYNLQYVIGLIAFWLDETWILRVMLNIATAFLSGAVIPIDLFPQWFADILFYTPFPLLTYVPIKVFMGQDVLPFFYVLLVLLFWNVIILLLTRFVWSRGLRLYTASGI